MSTRRSPLAASSGSFIFVEHLSDTLEAMDEGRLPLNPVAYRLFARRLRQTLVACPPLRRPNHPVGPREVVAEAVANLYFEDHGRLPQIGGKAVQFIAERLFERVRRA